MGLLRATTTAAAMAVRTPLIRSLPVVWGQGGGRAEPAAEDSRRFSMLARTASRWTVSQGRPARRPARATGILGDRSPTGKPASQVSRQDWRSNSSAGMECMKGKRR